MCRLSLGVIDQEQINFGIFFVDFKSRFCWLKAVAMRSNRPQAKLLNQKDYEIETSFSWLMILKCFPTCSSFIEERPRDHQFLNNYGLTWKLILSHQPFHFDWLTIWWVVWWGSRFIVPKIVDKCMKYSFVHFIWCRFVCCFVSLGFRQAIYYVCSIISAWNFLAIFNLFYVISFFDIFFIAQHANFDGEIDISDVSIV